MGITDERIKMMYVNIIDDMYEEASTTVTSFCGETRGFMVRVGVHQDEVPWCMLFMDDIVQVGESLENVNDRQKEWRVAFVEKKYRANRERKVMKLSGYVCSG